MADNIIEGKKGNMMILPSSRRSAEEFAFFSINVTESMD